MKTHHYLLITLTIVASCAPDPRRSEQQIVMEVNGTDTVWRTSDYPTKDDSIIQINIDHQGNRDTVFIPKNY